MDKLIGWIIFGPVADCHSIGKSMADHIFPKLLQLLPVNVIAHYFVFALKPDLDHATDTVAD